MVAISLEKNSPLTQEFLRSLLHYDPETGVFRWMVDRIGRGGKIPAGTEAGMCAADGYRYIGIGQERYAAKDVAWLYMTGEWPAAVVDHKNRQRGDDRWGNLRAASWVQNCQNKSLRSDNASGVAGVSFDKARGKWMARIKVGDKYLMLGRFATIDDAIAERRRAEQEHFGEFAPA